MAKRPERHGEEYERQLERMLNADYADTAPSVEFQESLVRQLDQEFSRTYLATDQFEAAVSPELNGATSVDQITNDAEKQAAAVHRRFVSLRLAVSMAVAASLMLVVALWNGQSAYGWASMLRALEHCDWVEAVSGSDGFGGWVSSQRGILAIKKGNHASFHDKHQQVSSQYLAEQGAIHQQDYAGRQSGQSSAEQLFSLLIRSQADAEDDVGRYKVASESWKSIPAEGGRDGVVELRVTLVSDGANRKSHKLVLLLDPETHLPMSCRVLASGGSAVASLDFDYPADGPRSIFALGVPRETRVVRSLVELETNPEQAQEAESTRVAAVTRSSDAALDATAHEEKVAEVASQRKQAATAEKLSARGPNGNEWKDSDLAIEQSVTQQIQAEEIVTLQPANSPAEQGAASASQAEELVASNPRSPRREFPVQSFFDSKIPLPELVGNINAQLRSYWQEQGVQVAEPASETEFLRRVYLDLTGRIPVPYEVYAYLEGDPQDRREKLVDELLSSRDHATHLASVWRKLLLPDGVDTNIYGGTGKFDEWLADRFAKNIPYDQLVRQLLLAEGRVSDSGPILFYASLKLNPEELAAKTSRTFLGMRMECAQCHDHPFDESISQEDFWGFAAHFAQISRPQGKIEMTSSVLRVRDNIRGEVMLPDSDEVVPPRLPYPLAMDVVQTKGDQTQSEKSRREVLVDWLTTKQNTRFARATVNRAWQHLFGLGLVEPADDMRADNPATCPDVLETLSHDFAANDYDLRRLLRALVLSNAYQLSSRAISDEPSQSLLFARMNIKSFSADQLYDCINVATEPDAAGADAAASGALARFGNTSRQAFIEQFQAPPGQRTDYHAGIPQALTLMHGRLVHGATDLASSGLLKSISAPFFSDEQRIETLFVSTLSRLPEQNESQTMLAHVRAATNDVERSRAFGDILWALLNSAEFTFIH